MIKARTAKFQIGQIVRHRVFSFRGVIFDIDPEFNNTEEWWLSIPEEVRPHKDQPFYHLLAENSEVPNTSPMSPSRTCCPGRFRRADPPFAGRRDLREGQGGRLPSAQSVAELARFTRNKRSAPATKKAPCSGAFCVLPGGAAATSLPDWRRPLLRASCAALQPSSAALPAVSSGFPRTASDRSADRHTPWRIHPRAAAAASAARRWN